RNSTLGKNSVDDIAQGRLRVLQAPGDADGTHVYRMVVGQIDIVFGIPRCEAVQMLANFTRRLSGAGPALISAHAFILGEADQHGLTGLELRRIPAPILDDVSQTKIVGAVEQVLRRSGQFVPRIPLAPA